MSYRLQPLFLQQETNQDEIHGDTLEKNEWLPHLKREVLSTAFSFAKLRNVWKT